MKKAILMAALAATGMAATVASAQEYGRVISTTPVVQQVAVPRDVCNDQVVVDRRPSGAGAVIGAIAGGILGHTVGGGAGNVLATGVGAVGGAVVGNKIEENNGASGNARNVRTCTSETTYENRTVAYNVLYEYAGRQYTTQMPYDPGQSIRVSVAPAQ